MQYWLIDADNQSPALALQTAAILGWPANVLMAGLPVNLKAWMDRSGFPETVTVEQWQAPLIPDGADVLLAMAVGAHLEGMESAAIISRDGLVAGTLGQILTARGIRVLAISAMTHPGLPYPHLTLPGELAIDKAMTDSGSQGPVPYVATINADTANKAMSAVFKHLGEPASVPKTTVGQLLRGQGFDARRRSAIFEQMTDYAYRGAGASLAVVPV